MSRTYDENGYSKTKHETNKTPMEKREKQSVGI